MIEQTPILNLHKATHSVYSLAAYFNGIKITHQTPADVVEEDKEDIDLIQHKSSLVTNDTSFEANINAFKFSKADFDFILSDHVHICTLSDAEFIEGTVDIVNMEECASVVVDDDEMLYSEDF